MVLLRLFKANHHHRQFGNSYHVFPSPQQQQRNRYAVATDFHALSFIFLYENLYFSASYGASKQVDFLTPTELIAYQL